jgi:hypothetical protein
MDIVLTSQLVQATIFISKTVSATTGNFCINFTVLYSAAFAATGSSGPVHCADTLGGELPPIIGRGFPRNALSGCLLVQNFHQSWGRPWNKNQ